MYIQPLFVTDVRNIIESEDELLEYNAFFSKCPEPIYEEGENLFPDYQISQYVFINRDLHRKMMKKYKKVTYEVFGGVDVLLINNIAYEPVEDRLWKIPDTINDSSHINQIKNCCLCSVYYYTGE
jgi:hypothetical protein